jgi:adenylosuccinate synthase
MGLNVETVVDINVNVDGKTMEFKQIPSSLSVANFGTNGVVISESQEAMASEVSNLIAQSKQILSSVDYHQKAIVAYENMLRQLNPQYAKEKQVDDTLNSLTNDVASMKSDLSKIIGILGKQNT